MSDSAETSSVRRWATKAQLRRECAAIGLRPGDTVMVHASLRAVGPVVGGPDVLISAILETIGGDGTMTMYVGCESPFDDVGRGLHSPEDERFILEHCPPFDPDAARASRDHGALAELFRTYPDVRCSRHVGARMGACGRNTEYLLTPASLNDGHGIGSPLERLCALGGKVLLIGSDFDQVTLLHYAEAVAPIPNKRTVRGKVPLLVDGVRTWLDFEELDSSTGVREWPDQRFFEHIVEAFIAQRGIGSRPIGNAPSYLLDASDLVRFAVPIMAAEAERLDAEERA
jgi:aminoglycoside 3-N-acetyltransferase